MRTIPLTQGKEALVSDCDYKYLVQWKWCYRKCNTGKCGYAVRNAPRPKGGTILMHRVIAARKKLNLSYKVDHRDRNKLNNQRQNLRSATPTQNNANSVAPVTNRSGFKGVSPIAKTGGWLALIKCHKKAENIGSFPGTRKGKKAAARAYNRQALRHFGKYAYLNRGV